MALSNLSKYCAWKNIKWSSNNNKIKINVPTWNHEFELLDGSYLILDIQDDFEYNLKKHGENIDNRSVKIYINKMKNRIVFKIKTEN